MVRKKLNFNIVFEGGGIKGIGLVGALNYIEDNYDVTYSKIGGTSAGSIVGGLLAAGYNAKELKDILFNMNFTQFLHPRWFSWLGGPLIKLAFYMNKVKYINTISPLIKGVGMVLNVVPGFINFFIPNYGLYSGRSFENWISNLLKNKGVENFDNLKYPLTIIGSDISHGIHVIIPRDLSNYGTTISSAGILPSMYPVKKGIRMSMSIPYFFNTVPLFYVGEKYSPGNRIVRRSRIVDGGLLSNYPIGLFKDDKDINTLGIRLDEGNIYNKIGGGFTMAWALINTMTLSHDKRAEDELKKIVRSIDIPVSGISAIDFDLPHSKIMELYNSGYQAAKQFFSIKRNETFFLLKEE